MVRFQQTPEQVDLPEEIEVELGQAVNRRDARREGRIDAGAAHFIPSKEGGAAHLGKPEGTAHPHRGPGFGHPGHGQTDIVVLGQGGADQVLESRVVEHLPPGQVGQAVEIRLGLTLEGLEAIILGHLPGVAIVFGGQAAAEEQGTDQK